MNRYISLFLLSWIIAGFQLLWNKYLPFYISVDFVLISIILISLEYGASPAMFFAIWTSLFVFLIVPGMVGWGLLVLSTIAYVLGTWRKQLAIDRFVNIVLVFFVSIILYHFIIDGIIAIKSGSGYKGIVSSLFPVIWDTIIGSLLFYKIVSLRKNK